MTQAAIQSALDAKADLADGVVPDAQAPSISVKKDTWVVDLNDHGGVGDGSTANDAAFVSALAAINPTWGGKIVVRAGSYLISGTTAIALSNFGTIIEGAGAEATKIVVGNGFTGTDVITITGPNCTVKDLSIVGSNTTPTSNPVTHGIYANGVRGTRVKNCNFWYLNGWAVHVVGLAASGSNPSGTMIDSVIIRTCAGGIRFLGNTGSGSVSSFVSNVQMAAIGVTTGTHANLDGIDIEDSWDVNVDNVIVWLTAGTGSAIHVKGNCITNTFRGVDLEGSNTGPCVLIEDGTNGSPYNTKIDVGTIQLGTIGIRVTGAARVLVCENLNVVNNATHGISIEGTGNPIELLDLYFTSNGNGASGTNYDINWSGASIGNIVNPRFETAVTAIGVAGIQKSLNVPSLQNVRVWNSMFAGVGNNSSNWYTNVPNALMDTTSGSFNFLSRSNFALGIITQGLLSSQQSSSTNVVLSQNLAGTATFDSFRLTADGSMNIGPGTAARDTTWGRYGVAQIGTTDSDIVIAMLGKGLKIKEGTNARMGTAILASGTITVANTSVTANTRIFVGQHTPGTLANVGAPYVSVVTAGTGFTIKSTNASDNSTVSYVLIEAAF
jgi:hypothetical protein